MSGCDWYVAKTDDQFEIIAHTLKNEDDVLVRELVRFETHEAPPPMVGRYYALWTDRANCWHCWRAKTMEELAKAEAWAKAENDNLFYATEAVL